MERKTLQGKDRSISHPRTRQRVHKAPPTLDVPDINDDAAERKRVLNILAQRRYRERRRQVRKIASGSSATAPKGTVIQGPDQDDAGETVRGDGAASEEAISSEDGIATTVAMSPSPLTLLGSYGPNSEGSEFGGYLARLKNASFESSSSLLPQDSLDPGVFYDLSSSFSSSSASPDSIDLPFSLDSYVLPVNEYNLLRAFTRIAARLGCKANLFDLHAASPFTDPAIPVSHLPQTWQPTSAQILVPHHPIMDFLPWPSVREKLLQVFTLPEQLRPPAASDPTALVHFAHDLEDGAEGIRVHGEDIYDSSSWEVGQVLFERWWFIFNRSVIEQSNAWRRRRGAPRLHVGMGGVGAGGGSTVISGQHSAGLATI
ncbi:unnamed protein product [Discula destructiva]